MQVGSYSSSELPRYQHVTAYTPGVSAVRSSVATETSVDHNFHSSHPESADFLSLLDTILRLPMLEASHTVRIGVGPKHQLTSLELHRLRRVWRSVE